MITKEMIYNGMTDWNDIIDNADYDQLELIESCNGDLETLLDNL